MAGILSIALYICLSFPEYIRCNAIMNHVTERTLLLERDNLAISSIPRSSWASLLDGLKLVWPESQRKFKTRFPCSAALWVLDRDLYYGIPKLLGIAIKSMTTHVPGGPILWVGLLLCHFLLESIEAIQPVLWLPIDMRFRWIMSSKTLDKAYKSPENAPRKSGSFHPDFN